MVQGIPELKRRLGKVAERIRKEVRPEMAGEAARIVAQMRALRPLANIEVAWVWGPAPAGVLALGQVASKRFDTDYITIYATATTREYPGGFPAIARWFEFGTLNRFHDTGKFVGSITASPYFFPVYRANRNGVRNAIARKVRATAKNL